MLKEHSIQCNQRASSSQLSSHHHSTETNLSEDSDTVLSDSPEIVMDIQVENTRAQMKKVQRKQAKIELKAQRRTEKVLPHFCHMVHEMAVMIETNLQAQVRLSNVKYNVFVHDTPHHAVDAMTTKTDKHSELTKGKKAASTLYPRLEQQVTKMMTTLRMSRECLVIAWVYICRAVSKMQQRQFFLSNATAEK